MNARAKFLRSIFFIMALLGTLPVGAQVERIETMKVELEAAWYQAPEDQVLVRVVEKEQQQGRKFTAEEVAAEVEHLTGKTLKHNCFTCRMRVLTPGGYVAIGSLKKGDAIYSWNEGNSTLVQNVIVQIHTAARSPFGILPQTATPVALEVSGAHPFLLPEEGLYSPIGQIEPGNVLRAIRYEPTGSCPAFLVKRGDFKPAGVADLFNLTVESPPHNFIVEGLVVHNKPLQIM